MSAYTGIVCLRCGAPGDETACAALGCSECAVNGDAAGYTTTYNLDSAAAAFDVERLADKGRDLWRYRELLPPVEDPVTLGEGGTPLIAAERLASRVGVAALWVKDESRNPTWSFKDRAASVAASMALMHRAPALVVSSTGNAAAAAAAYANRAGIPAIVLAARSIDPLMARFLAAYEPQLLATETKPERWIYVRRCVEEWGCFPNSNFADPPVGNSPWAIDGYKTIAFEIWEQLGRRAPDWIHLPVAYGDGLYGVAKGFLELGHLGLSSVPRLGAGEIYGSLATAVASGRDRVERAAVDHETAAFSIATAQSTYQALVAIRSTSGWVDRVAEGELVAAQRLLLETEGMFVEAAAAAGLAALLRQRRAGLVAEDAECVLVSTSAGVKSVGTTPELSDLEFIRDADELDRAIERVLGTNLTRGRRSQ